MRNSAAYLDKIVSGITSHFKMGNDAVRSAIRLDSNSNLIRGILTEAAATNCMTYSSTLSSWDATYCTAADNAIASSNPYGYLSSLSEDSTASAQHSVALTEVVASSSNADYCFSAKLKKSANRTWAALGVTLGSGSSPIGYFNLNTGVVGTMTNVVSYGIKSLGNDIYLCWIHWYDAGSITLTPRIYIASADGTYEFNGGDQLSIYAGEAQLELGTYPSSLVDTAGATAIRATDRPIYFKADDGNIDTLTGNGAEGAIELKVLGPPVPPGRNCELVEISDGGNSYNRVKLSTDWAGRPKLYVNKKTANSTNTFTATAGTATGSQADPDGGTNATLYTEDDAETTHYLTANPTGFTGEGEVACWFKYAGRRYVRFYKIVAGATDWMTVDLITCEVYAMGGDSPTRYGDYGIRKSPDGWIRPYFISERLDAAANSFIAISIADDGSSTTTTGLDGAAFYVYAASVTEKADNLLALNNDITGWTASNVTLANADAVTDPMGTNLADVIHETDTAAGSLHTCYAQNDPYTVVSGKKYKLTGCFKAINRYAFLFGMRTSVAARGGIIVNLTAGTISFPAITNVTSYDGWIESLGDDWYRCSYIFSDTNTSLVLWARVSLYDGANGTFDGANQDSIYAYGIRLEEYPSEIEVVGTPVNLLDNNYSANTAYWTRSSIAVTGTGISDPYGGKNGTTLNDDSSTSHNIYKQLTRTVSVGDLFCFSLVAKKALGTWIRLLCYSDTTGYLAHSCYFNLATGVKGTANNLTNSDIHYINNGWYLCWIAWTHDIAFTSIRSDIFLAEGDGDITFSGSSQNHCYICNPVLETGVATRTRFNVCDGKIHRVAGCWKNGYAAVEVDSQITGAPSTSILTANIPTGLDRIDLGPSNGLISDLSLFPGAQGRK